MLLVRHRQEVCEQVVVVCFGPARDLMQEGFKVELVWRLLRDGAE